MTKKNDLINTGKWKLEKVLNYSPDIIKISKYNTGNVFLVHENQLRMKEFKITFTPELLEVMIFLKDKWNIETDFIEKFLFWIPRQWVQEARSYELIKIGKIIYNNLDKISSIYIESSKKERIFFTIKEVQNFFKEPKLSFGELKIIKTDKTDFSNKFLDNLKRDFMDWDKSIINLGIINDLGINDNYNISKKQLENITDKIKNEKNNDEITLIKVLNENTKNPNNEDIKAGDTYIATKNRVYFMTSNTIIGKFSIDSINNIILFPNNMVYGINNKDEIYDLTLNLNNWNSKKIDKINYIGPLIKKVINKKYPNFDVSQIEIIDKDDYSNISQDYKSKIRVNFNSTDYSYGLLKPKLSYITQTKINKISNIIANDKDIKNLIKHIKYWNSTLPKAIENAKTFTLEHLENWKRQETINIQNYLARWNSTIRIIKNELNIEELNKNVQGLKSDFETIKNQINDLNEKLENTTTNWNCANIGGIVATASAPVPAIGTAASLASGLIAGSCAIFGV